MQISKQIILVVIPFFVCSMLAAQNENNQTKAIEEKKQVEEKQQKEVTAQGEKKEAEAKEQEKVTTADTKEVEQKKVAEEPAEKPDAEKIEEKPSEDVEQAEEKVEEKKDVQTDEAPEEEPIKDEQKEPEKPTDDVTDDTKPEDQAKQPSDEPEEEVIGIDTVDLDEPQGNWLFKRVWWERAEAKYEKIRSVVASIMESRMAFFTQRSQLDKNILDPFYLKIGLGQGELQEVLSQLIAKLEKEREQAGMLSAQERDMLKRLEEEKETLKQMQLDVEAITKADNTVDDALSKLMDQINRARSYEQEAWKNFKEIARVLNDKKARELYYKVDGALRNINDMQQYLKKSFTDSFDKLVANTKDQVNRVQKAIEGLKEKGVDLKKQAAQLADEEKPIEIEVDEDNEQQEVPQKGFFAKYIVGPIAAIFGFFGSVIKTIWNYTFGLILSPITKLFTPAQQIPVEVTVEENRTENKYSEQT